MCIFCCVSFFFFFFINHLWCWSVISQVQLRSRNQLSGRVILWCVASCVSPKCFILTPCFSCGFCLNLKFQSQILLCTPWKWGATWLLRWQSPLGSSSACRSTTAVSFLSHCIQVTELFGVWTNPCWVSHRARLVNVSETVHEVLSQFWIRS